MTQFIPFSRDQAFLLPPDAKDWLPADDVAPFVVAAVERVPLRAFEVRAREVSVRPRAVSVHHGSRQPF